MRTTTQQIMAGLVFVGAFWVLGGPANADHSSHHTDDGTDPHRFYGPADTFTLIRGEWERPWEARDIAIGGPIGPNRVQWVIGTTRKPGGYNIYRVDGKESRTEWRKKDVYGGAVRIAVDNTGTPWIVNNKGLIFARQGVSVSNKEGTGWQQVAGRARDIAASPDGYVFIIGTDPKPGGYTVYRFRAGVWRTVKGMGGVRIALGPQGTPWIVNDVGEVYNLPFFWEATGWRRYPGVGAKDIGVGAGGVVWVTGLNNSGIHYLADEDNGTWAEAPGLDGVMNIAVGYRGNPWVVTEENRLFKGNHDRFIIQAPGGGDCRYIGNTTSVWNSQTNTCTIGQMSVSPRGRLTIRGGARLIVTNKLEVLKDGVIYVRGGGPIFGSRLSVGGWFNNYGRLGIVPKVGSPPPWVSLSGPYGLDNRKGAGIYNLAVYNESTGQFLRGVFYNFSSLLNKGVLYNSGYLLNGYSSEIESIDGGKLENTTTGVIFNYGFITGPFTSRGNCHNLSSGSGC